MQFHNFIIEHSRGRRRRRRWREDALQFGRVSDTSGGWRITGTSAGAGIWLVVLVVCWVLVDVVGGESVVSGSAAQSGPVSVERQSRGQVELVMGRG